MKATNGSLVHTTFVSRNELINTKEFVEPISADIFLIIASNITDRSCFFWPDVHLVPNNVLIPVTFAAGNEP